MCLPLPFYSPSRLFYSWLLGKVIPLGFVFAFLGEVVMPLIFNVWARTD